MRQLPASKKVPGISLLIVRIIYTSPPNRLDFQAGRAGPRRYPPGLGLYTKAMQSFGEKEGHTAREDKIAAVSRPGRRPSPPTDPTDPWRPEGAGPRRRSLAPAADAGLPSSPPKTLACRMAPPHAHCACFASREVLVVMILPPLSFIIGRCRLIFPIFLEPFKSNLFLGVDFPWTARRNECLDAIRNDGGGERRFVALPLRQSPDDAACACLMIRH